jgi:hypothetical protein
MRRLKKWWKRLHRLVYAAAVMGAVHGVIAAANGKKAFFRDDAYIHEMKAYLVVLIVLLVLRVPLVRRAVHKVVAAASALHLHRLGDHDETAPTPVIERYIEESGLIIMVPEDPQRRPGNKKPAPIAEDGSVCVAEKATRRG